MTYSKTGYIPRRIGQAHAAIHLAPRRTLLSHRAGRRHSSRRTSRAFRRGPMVVIDPCSSRSCCRTGPGIRRFVPDVTSFISLSLVDSGPVELHSTLVDSLVACPTSTSPHSSARRVASDRRFSVGEAHSAGVDPTSPKALSSGRRVANRRCFSVREVRLVSTRSAKTAPHSGLRGCPSRTRR
jgi:hypothetical protein